MSSKSRPTSPHATLYRLPIGMRTSIFHRLTAIFLYVIGVPFFALYLLSIAAGPTSYDFFVTVARSWIGTVILFGATWCLCQHLASGVRHLFMDLGTGTSLKYSRLSAIATYIFSFSVSLVIWAIAKS